MKCHLKNIEFNYKFPVFLNLFIFLVLISLVTKEANILSCSSVLFFNNFRSVFEHNWLSLY